jgi:hypothetical protein
MKVDSLARALLAKKLRRIWACIAVVLLGVGLTRLASAGECDSQLCSYLINIERSGFYVITAALPPNGSEGLFDLEITANWSPPSSLTGPIHSGSVLKDRGAVPSYSVFSPRCTAPINVVIDDYGTNLEKVRFRLLALGGENREIFSTIARIGDPFLTPTLAKDLYYVAELSSGTAQPRGRFGLSLASGSDAECGFHTALHAAGWLDDYTSASPEGFLAVWLSAGKLQLTLRFGGYFGSLGASQPDLAVRFLNDSGLYEPFWSSPAVVRINENGTQARGSEISADGRVAAYQVLLQGRPPAWRLLRHDLLGDLVVPVSAEPSQHGSLFEHIRDVQISETGQRIAYGVSASYPWPAGPKVTSYTVYVYDADTGIRDFVRRLASYQPGFDIAMAEYEDTPILAINSHPETQAARIELYDMWTGYLDGLDLSGLAPRALSISADASVVAIQDDSAGWCMAPNICGSVYVIEVEDGQQHFAPRTRDGVVGDLCGEPDVAGEGRFTAFRCGPEELSAIYVYDLTTGFSDKVVEAPGLATPRLSRRGQLLVFSAPMPLGSPTPDAIRGIYLARLEHGAKGSSVTEILPLTPNADGESTDPSISGDGRFVTFTSRATNLTESVVNETPNVFLYREPSKVVSLSGVR